MSDLVFARDYDIPVGSLDNFGRVRPSFLFAAMQDTAVAHMEHLHLGKTVLPVFWVLSRIALTLYRPLPPQARLQCQTWCAAIRGASPIRLFTFTAGGTCVAQARSMWVMLDPATRRIVRPTAFGDTITRLVRDPTSPPPAPLPKLSGETVTPHHVYTVRYSDLDENNHLNNVRAVELVCDALELQAKPDWVSFLQMNYTAEIRYGENLLLACGQPKAGLTNLASSDCAASLAAPDSFHYVQGTVDDIPHFNALAACNPA